MAIEFRDEVTGHDYLPSPDITVVDERISRGLCGTSRRHSGARPRFGGLPANRKRPSPACFHQPPRHPGGRAGPGRPVAGRCTRSRLRRTGRSRPRQHGDRTVVAAEIDPGHCIRCLTCFRLCPYGAVNQGSRIAVVADACAGCGICVAECPRGAIRSGIRCRDRKPPQSVRLKRPPIPRWSSLPAPAAHRQTAWLQIRAQIPPT